MGLRLRVILILVIPAVLLVGTHGYLRVRQQQGLLLAEDRKSMDLTVAATQIAMENALRHRQIGDVRRLVSEMVDRQDTIDRLRLFDVDGKPMLSSTPAPDGDAAIAEIVRRVVRTSIPDARYDLRASPPVLYYVVPLRSGTGQVQGAMEIVHVANGIGRRTREAVLDVWIRLGILLGALVLLIWFALQRQVLRPLALLTAGIQRLGRGETSAPLAVGRRDEIGRVAVAFNEMAADLEQARVRLLVETERALEFEQELRRAETLAVAGRLTSALAHEVGTPLNIISGRAEFLAKSLPADDPGRKDLEIIVGQIDRITRIIASLLDSVRPRRPEVRATPIEEVFGSIMPLLRHAARRQQVTLVSSVGDTRLSALADAGQLQQVLINLVMNAVDATAAGGTVHVTATGARRGDRPGVELTVADTGGGIQPEALPRIFEPFFTTKAAGRGTGLGLSICRDIVVAHEGHIGVDSQVGRGTTFSVWLPSAGHPVAA
jgi:two-component system, NtrC family, sensor kinase